LEIKELSEEELNRRLPIVFRTHYKCGHWCIGVLTLGEFELRRSFCPLCEDMREILRLEELRRLDGDGASG
jgi:hypothetical protein